MDERRRDFLVTAGLWAGGAAALGFAARPLTAAHVEEYDPRLDLSWEVWPGGDRTLSGYLARPKADRRPPGVVVAHDESGLTPQVRDIARRLAVAGFVAVAPHLPPAGDAASAAAVLGDTIAWLAGGRRSSGVVGLVGFGAGGGLVARAAADGAGKAAAGVIFYGAPPPRPAVAAVDMPLLFHLAGTDPPINRAAEPWISALRRAEKPVTAYSYPGTVHAFADDDAPTGFDAVAATLAWGRTTAFLRQHLAAGA